MLGAESRRYIGRSRPVNSSTVATIDRLSPAMPAATSRIASAATASTVRRPALSTISRAALSRGSP